ncbi:hypothetical protein RhoFasB10_00714 [Rhodococcus sp. B10]|nr:hypothetical protein [Rhodococcus sp. B10]
MDVHRRASTVARTSPARRNSATCLVRRPVHRLRSRRAPRAARSARIAHHLRASVRRGCGGLVDSAGVARVGHLEGRGRRHCKRCYSREDLRRSRFEGTVHQTSEHHRTSGAHRHLRLLEHCRRPGGYLHAARLRECRSGECRRTESSAGSRVGMHRCRDVLRVHEVRGSHVAATAVLDRRGTGHRRVGHLGVLHRRGYAHPVDLRDHVGHLQRNRRAGVLQPVGE